IREPILCVVPNAEKTRLVAHVVLKDNAHVWVEVNAALGHHLEHFIVGEDAMLDLPATGTYRSLDGLRRVRVNHRPQSMGFRLPASGIQLFLRHRLLTAITNAG